MRHLCSLLLIALLVHTAVGWQSYWEKEREKEKDKVKATVNAASAGINNLAGVFKQVNQAGEPIFKHVSGGDWGMRQINTVGRQALYKPSYFGTAVNGLGKVVWVGAAAMEALNVVEAVGKDAGTGKLTNTVHAAGKAAGGWTGAAYGASVGAAALSFIPGVGTLAGGLIGGAIGAYTGSAVGDAAATVVAGQA